MAIELRAKEKSRHHDDEQKFDVAYPPARSPSNRTTAAKLFFPYTELKVESMYHNKEEVPPNG